MKMSANEILTLMEKGWSKEEIIALCNASTTTTKPTMGTSRKAPKKGTNSKAPSTFDRDSYVACAKKLGCYNEEYGKVTATVENGKVVRTAKKNRELVYAEMGKDEAPTTEEPLEIRVSTKDMDPTEAKHLAIMAKVLAVAEKLGIE